MVKIKYLIPSCLFRSEEIQTSISSFYVFWTNFWVPRHSMDIVANKTILKIKHWEYKINSNDSKRGW